MNKLNFIVLSKGLKSLHYDRKFYFKHVLEIDIFQTIIKPPTFQETTQFVSRVSRHSAAVLLDDEPQLLKISGLLR